MKDDILDRLLDEKRAVPAVFKTTEAEFTEQFFAKIKTEEKPRFSLHSVIPWIAAAAVVFVVFGSALTLFLIREPVAARSQDRLLTETLRIFGDETAVVYLNDELITGERDPESRAQNQIKLFLTGSDGKQIRLQLAASDHDTIAIGAGSIVVSRCDAETLVLDLDLRLDNGQVIRSAVPVTDHGDNRYNGDYSA